MTVHTITVPLGLVSRACLPGVLMLLLAREVLEGRPEVLDYPDGDGDPPLWHEPTRLRWNALRKEGEHVVLKGTKTALVNACLAAAAATDLLYGMDDSFDTSEEADEDHAQEALGNLKWLARRGVPIPRGLKAAFEAYLPKYD